MLDQLDGQVMYMNDKTITLLDEDEEACIESEYMSYLESGGTGEKIPMEFDEWKRSQLPVVEIKDQVSSDDMFTVMERKLKSKLATRQKD